MTDRFLFSDEAGDFAFTRAGRASRYFINTSVVMDDCTVGDELLKLRRQLTREGHITASCLHARNDPWPVRNLVYPILAAHDFRIDVTILEKAKAQPQTHTSNPVFFQYAWFYHLKHVVPRVVERGDNVLITAASLEVKSTKTAFKQALNNAAQQTLTRNQWRVSFIQSSEDPCLWATDYCSWAIQRKWETGDETAYQLIKPKIASEYDLWKRGRRTYY
ncbi:MAG: hypothetical protein EOO15_16765 [Chitinophagaceae bacterium]|nr:MAG: hypothetical protein EOO15_16765 [Chitinophagaceae bacterium]